MLLDDGDFDGRRGKGRVQIEVESIVTRTDWLVRRRFLLYLIQIQNTSKGHGIDRAHILELNCKGNCRLKYIE
jgi:hypothetical protein